MTQDQLLGLDESHSSLGGAWPPSPDRRHRGGLQRHAGGRRPRGFNPQAASSWRSFERQLAIWNGKWRGAPCWIRTTSPSMRSGQLGDMERLHAILRWSALPGTSRHHWGTDLDIYDPDCLPAGTKPRAGALGYEAGAGLPTREEWLDDHMNDFGFFLPYARGKGQGWPTNPGT